MFLGLLIFIVSAAKFLAIQILVASISAVLVDKSRRKKTFLLVFFLWFVYCALLSWGRPLAELLWAMVQGKTWGSFTEPYPGYLAQYLKYLMANGLFPFPHLSIWVMGISAVTVWSFFFIIRTKKRCDTLKLKRF